MPHRARGRSGLISFEFFPPKSSQGMETLTQSAIQLSGLHPSFFSVTFGASGSDQDKTMKTVSHLSNIGDIPIAPHLSCVHATQANVQEKLAAYKTQKVDRLVVIRGDTPPQAAPPTDFPYSSDLVEFIRETTGNYFHIEVSAYPECHPESLSPQQDIDSLKKKLDAGANCAITQYFYNIDAYHDFLESCTAAQITLPIVPGIMPIVDYRQLQKFSDSCGAELPRWLRKKLEYYQDDKAAMHDFGIEVVCNLCDKLLEENVPGLHFYTLNRGECTWEICQQLSLHDRLEYP